MRAISIALAAAMTLSAGAALAKDGENKKAKGQVKTVEIPTCTHSLGNLAIRDAENEWWNYYGLGNPKKILGLIVMKSRCFQLVDRGEGMEMMKAERDLVGGDELQRGSNIGKAQMVAADYFMLPDVITGDQDAGGKSLGGGLGGFLGGRTFGGVLGGIKTKKLEAQTVLTVTNARTGVQELIVDGYYKKTDISFGAGGGLFSAGLGLAVAGGGYADTDIGKVITIAFVEAYTNMVTQMGGLSGDPKGAAPLPAQRLVENTPLLAAADEKSSVVMGLREGALVYPTGTKEGVFWEVEDEHGNKGWVSSYNITLAK